jgi:hypothetical protein
MVKTIVLGMRFDCLFTAAVLAALIPVLGGPLVAERAAQEGAARGPVVPVCEVRTGGDYFPSYIEDSFPQLKEAVPALRGLRLGEGASAEEGENVLNKMGETITGMMPRLPNLIAKEEVSQGGLALPYMVSQGNQVNNSGMTRGRSVSTSNVSAGAALRSASSNEVRDAIQRQLDAPKNRIEFSYRIQFNAEDGSDSGIREFRMNAQNEAIVAASASPGNPRGVGFGSSWVMFEPRTLNQFRFRYLGREKIGKRDTVVLAFAQIPERVDVPAQISVGGTTCSYFMQGVVWIDPSIFQMTRLQTDLLAPLSGFHQKKLRSEVDFGEVRIPARDLTVWMPSRVEISWEMDNQAGAELHKYSDYRLFGSTSRILPVEPE